MACWNTALNGVCYPGFQAWVFQSCPLSVLSWGSHVCLWDKDPGLSPTSGGGLDELLVRASGFLNLPSSWGFLGPFNVHFLLRASWSFLEQVRGGGCWEAQSRGGIGVQKPGFQSPQYCLSLIVRTKNRTAAAISASVSHLKKKDSRFLVDVNDKIWWPSLFDKWQLKYGLGWLRSIRGACQKRSVRDPNGGLCVPPTNGCVFPNKRHLSHRVFSDYLVDIYLPAGRVFYSSLWGKIESDGHPALKLIRNPNF